MAVSDIASPLLGNAVYFTCFAPLDSVYPDRSVKTPYPPEPEHFGHYYAACIRSYTATVSPTKKPNSHLNCVFFCPTNSLERIILML